MCCHSSQSGQLGCPSRARRGVQGILPQQPITLCTAHSCYLILSHSLQATSVGQAVAGFAVSVLSFITTWAAWVPEPGQERGPGDVAATAAAYFALSAAVVVASGAGYWMLLYLPFWLHHTSSHSGHGRPFSRSEHGRTQSSCMSWLDL